MQTGRELFQPWRSHPQTLGGSTTTLHYPLMPRKLGKMEALFYNISLIAGQIVCYVRPEVS